MSAIVIGGNATVAHHGDLNPLESIAGSCSLVISSTFTGAKNGAKASAPAGAFSELEPE